MNIRIFTLLIAVFSLGVRADIYDYIYPNPGPSFSNYGGLGLIQNPNARFLKEGSLAFTWSHNDPYLRGSIVAYPFNWLEAAYQYTDVNDELYSTVKDFSGSQSLKDKSFDIKLRLLEETKVLPQIAFGLRDFGGTGRFASEYLVASKMINSLVDFDLSFGIGWANLNGNKIQNPLTSLSTHFESRTRQIDLGGKVNTKTFLTGDAGLFGGVEFSIPNARGAKFKIEFDGTNYQTESNPQIQKSKINYGLVYPASDRLIFKISSSRGTILNFGFSYSLNLSSSNPNNINKVKRKKIENKNVVKSVTSRSDETLYKAAWIYLSREGISLQKASVNEEELHVVYSQSKYRNPSLSIGRAMNTLNDLAPEKIKKIKISEINVGMGMYSASLSRKIIDKYNAPYEDPTGLMDYLKTEPYIFNESNHAYNPPAKYPSSFLSLGTDLKSQIGGPDGFFFGDLKIQSKSEILFNRKLSLITVLNYGLINNLDSLKLSSDSILPHVRTDIVKYLQNSKDFAIERMQLNYYDKLSSSLYYKLSGGIFESMFNGFGAEFLYRPHNEDYGIGFELWQVQQRAYNQMFGTRDYQTLTGHVSLYYKEPRSNILIHLKGGKYLAKDSGFTFDASRLFRSGLRIGAFFSLTDISEEEFGEGSFDKGIYFWIPVELFSRKYFKKTFGWGLRPLTRDGAQSLTYGYPLWGVTDGSNDKSIRDGIQDFYE